MSWNCGDEMIRNLWELDPAVAFLNHGSYGAVPLSVYQHRLNVIREVEANPANFHARLLPARLEQQRSRLAEWLNAEAHSLAFVPNATSGVGAVLASLEWRSGDEVIFHNHGYGWVRQGLANLAARHQVVLKEAHFPWPVNSDDLIVSAFEEQINKKTKLLICDHISSPTALSFPVKRIIKMAQSKGVPVLVDGAHAPGFLPLDLQDLKPDFYVGNLHKWLCAPRGSAFLSVSDAYRGRIRPESLCYSDGVTNPGLGKEFSGYFDWTGTADYSAWLSIDAALDFNESIGWDIIFRKRRALLLEAKSILMQKLSLNASDVAEDERITAMLTVPWPLRRAVQSSIALARELSEWLLREHKVEVPVLCFENRIYFRVSAQIYNHLGDYERLADAVAVHPHSLM